MISLIIDSIEDDELAVPEKFEQRDSVPDVAAVGPSGQAEDASPVGGGGVRPDVQVKRDFVLWAPVLEGGQLFISGDRFCGKAFLKTSWPICASLVSYDSSIHEVFVEQTKQHCRKKQLKYGQYGQSQNQVSSPKKSQSKFGKAELGLIHMATSCNV